MSRALELMLLVLVAATEAGAQTQPGAGKAGPPSASWVTPAPKAAAAPAPAAGSAAPAVAVPAQAAPAPATAAPAPATAAPAPAAARPAPSAPALTTTPAADDFDLLAPAPVFDAAQLAQAQETERKLATRRTLLGWHQLAGFVNLAGVATAVVIGQLNYTDKYGGGGDTEKWHTAHQIAAYGSAGIFAATGLLALFAPSPIDQPVRLSNATVHKSFMAVASAAMVAEVVLGIVTARKQGQISQRDLALAHQIIGYTAAVSTAGGFIAITW